MRMVRPFAGPIVAQSLQRCWNQPELLEIINLNVLVLNFREAMKIEPLPWLIVKLAAAACLLGAACTPTGAMVQTSVEQIDAMSAHEALVAGGPVAVEVAALAETGTAMPAGHSAPTAEATPALLANVSATATATEAPAVIAPTASPEPTAAAPPVWGYSGDFGPQAWAEMDPAFALCGSGAEQSPIDLSGGTIENLVDLRVNYLPAQLALANDGYTVRADYPAGSSLQVDGVDYALLNFEMHHPSEHTVNGVPFAMELQLIHQSAAGSVAVLSVFATAGAPNPAYQQLWDRLPVQAGATQAVPAIFSAASLLPADSRTVRYNGSFTAPPCTEGVRWLLFVQPVELSAAQIEAFAVVFPDNSRPLQLASGRVPQVDSTSN